MVYMSTDTTWETLSTSSDETEKLGELIGQKLRGGEVIELVSDLGGGKTTLVRGLVRGLGSDAVVSSPTFMLERVYPGRLEVHHFDLYRLGESGILGQELEESLTEEGVVNIMEWGDVAHNILPAGRLKIELNRTHEGEDIRQIVVTYPSELDYLITAASKEIA